MTQTIEQTSTTKTTTSNTKDTVVVSFVIPALNEEKWVSDCIDSVQSLTLPAIVGQIEIIVVDNQSTDQTVPISRQKGAAVVSCPPGNPSRARNAGAEQAIGDWIAFVDADCHLDKDWLVQCAEALVPHEVIAVGSQIAPPEDSSSWVTHTLGQLAHQDGNVKPTQVRWLPTAGLIVKKEPFDAIDGFDERLITCEDCDLGYRLSDRGKLILVPEATLIHYGESKSLNQVLWREAWRTGGNLRLAISRPSDLRNWISLLLPVAFAFFVLVGVLGTVCAFAGIGSPLPSIGVLLLGGAIPLVLSLRKLKHSISIGQLMCRWMVMITFLAGRALGLVWRFPRVER